MTEKYESPLSSRYASEYMLKLFSMDTRIQTWRKLWVSLARAEMELGRIARWADRGRRRTGCPAGSAYYGYRL